MASTSSDPTFLILPTQNPKSDQVSPAADTPTPPPIENTLQLPNSVSISPAPEFLPLDPAPAAPAPAPLISKHAASLGQDEQDTASARREQELRELGDVAKEFLQEKREKFQRLSVLRSHRMREMMVFGLFLILVCIVAVLARQTLSSNLQSRGMHNFMAEEGESPSNKSHVKLNMAGQGAWDDVREWLQSVFYRRLYSGNSGALYYSDGAARLLPILGNNMVVGNVQVRQLRLKTLEVGSSNECKVPDMIARLYPSCYPHFSTANEETAALSDYLTLWESLNQRNSSQAELPWAWWTPHSTYFKSSYVYSHFGLDYPNGGYILKMPKDPEAGRLALANLYLDKAPLGWLKSNTSAALLTEWVLYNPNTNLFYTYTTLFENRHAGGIPSETVRVVNLERFKGDLESVIVAGVEVCLFGYILFYMVIEARNIRRVGFSAWVTDGYSLIMAVIICLFIVVIVFEIILFVAAAEMLSTNDLRTIEIRSLSFIIYYSQTVLDIYSVIVLLSWFRLGKYLDIISPKTRMLSETVARSAPDIAYFLILFFCVYMGFVTAFQTGFGDQVFEFRNFKESLVGTFRAVLEDFDYDAFKEANAILGPILLVIFIFIIIFLLVEMFLGIVMANYEEVLDILGEEEDELPTHLRSQFKKRMQNASFKFLSCINRNKVAPEPEKDPSLSIRELLKFYEESREMFESAGFKSAAELQEVVDNSDGAISIGEMRAFAKMHQKENIEKEDAASTIASLKDILSVADRVDEELKQLKAAMLA